MPIRSLTGRRAAKLFALAVEHLRFARLDVPGADEGETSYTRRCLAPSLKLFLNGLGFRGLTTTGGAEVGVRTSYFLGMNFYPDLGVNYFEIPVFAVEVKLLKGGSRQGQVAKALGQARLYKQRYAHVAVFLVDVTDRTSDREIRDAAETLGDDAALIVRRVRRGQELSVHPEAE